MLQAVSETYVTCGTACTDMDVGCALVLVDFPRLLMMNHCLYGIRMAEIDLFA